jgi:hypothetical protein
MMLDHKTIVIIYLSVLLTGAQYFWLQAEKRASYFEGRQSVAEEIQKAVDDIEPPYDNSQPHKPIHRGHHG